jgi:hypothetical protein
LTNSLLVCSLLPLNPKRPVKTRARSLCQTPGVLVRYIVSWCGLLTKPQSRLQIQIRRAIKKTSQRVLQAKSRGKRPEPLKLVLAGGRRSFQLGSSRLFRFNRPSAIRTRRSFRYGTLLLWARLEELTFSYRTRRRTPGRRSRPRVTQLPLLWGLQLVFVRSKSTFHAFIWGSHSHLTGATGKLLNRPSLSEGISEEDPLWVNYFIFSMSFVQLCALRPAPTAPSWLWSRCLACSSGQGKFACCAS